MLIIRDGEFIRLTRRDRQRRKQSDRQIFADALLNPVPPSDQAIKDARWY
jgi:hypothetical protein